MWLIAAIAATLGHQIYFVLGRHFGDPYLARLPQRWQPLLFTWLGYAYGTAAGAVLRHVAHYETWILLGAVTLGLLVYALSPRTGSRLT